jgi:hypothetical protein
MAISGLDAYLIGVLLQVESTLDAARQLVPQGLQEL